MVFDKTAIVEALSPLIGTELWGSHRAAGMQGFQFGGRRTVPDRHGGEKIVGDYAIHVDCPWRIQRAERIVIGSRDVYSPADDSVDWADFDWDVQGANGLDVKMALLFSERSGKPLLVQEIRVAEFGGFQLVFSDGLSLEVFPVASGDDEAWRIFQGWTHGDHFVVSGLGAGY
jgi:hypothetical protein